MRKYKVISRISKPVSYEWFEDVPLLPALSVYESDDNARDTGLVDERGLPIYSFQEREAIGFTFRKGYAD